MNIKKSFQILLFLFSFNLLYSQNPYSTFVEGKKMFFLGNYSKAIVLFDSLIQKENEFKIYSIYYSALCNYYQNDYDNSLKKFNQIHSDYSDWPQVDESNYWLAKLLIHKKDYDNAFEIISKIKSSQIKEELFQFIDPIIYKINDFNRLKKWHNNFPQNLIIAKYYGRKLLNEPINELILEEIQNILKKIPRKDLFVDADEYTFNIAVLLPFMYNEYNKMSLVKNNKFIFDLYNGIRLGKEHLDSLGIKINILPYDTRRDPNVVKEILDSNNFNMIDLIIGPLYPSPVKIVKQFCLENKLVMLNPLSSNNQIIDDNDYAMLFMPSNKTIALTAAQYAKDKYNKNKNALIFYENNRVDSLIASVYENEMKSYGFNFIYSQKVDLDQSRLILDSLTNSYELLLSNKDADSISEIPGRIVKEGRGIGKLDTTYRYEKKFYLGYDSVGHVFTVSSNSLLSSNTLSGVDVREDTISVLGFGEWLNYDVITLDQLNRLDVSLISPKYVNLNSVMFNYLKKIILSSRNEIPSENLIIGFEIINMIGDIVNKYGKYFQFGLRNEDVINGVIFKSFKYNLKNDNQFVPIVKFVDSELKIVNY